MALKTSFSTVSLLDIVVQGGFKVKSVLLSNYQSPSYIITSGPSVQRRTARLDGLIPREVFLTLPHPMGPVRPLNMSETILKLEQIVCDCFFLPNGPEKDNKVKEIPGRKWQTAKKSWFE